MNVVVPASSVPAEVTSALAQKPGVKESGVGQQRHPTPPSNPEEFNPSRISQTIIVDFTTDDLGMTLACPMLWEPELLFALLQLWRTQRRESSA